MKQKLSSRGYTDRLFNISGFAVTFSDLALRDLQTQIPSTAEDVRRMIGHYLCASYLDNPQQLNTRFRIDTESFCAHRGITLKQYAAQEAALTRVGLARFCGHAENRPGEGYIWLTQDGVQWAMSGFGTRSRPVNYFSFEFNITIDTSRLIRDVISANIDPDVKAEAIEAAQQIKNEPTIEKVGRLVELAANTQQLLPTVIRFIADIAGAMSQMVSHVPHEAHRVEFTTR